MGESGSEMREEFAKTGAFHVAPVLRTIRRCQFSNVPREPHIHSASSEPPQPAPSDLTNPRRRRERAGVADRQRRGVRSHAPGDRVGAALGVDDPARLRCRLRRVPSETRPRDSASPGAGTVLAETLLAAVARAPVDVRILLNATLLLDTTRPAPPVFCRPPGSAEPDPRHGP